MGTAKLEHPVFEQDGTVIQPPRCETYRKGTSFWSVADEQGVRCKILNVPFAFPADKLRNGIMVCGLGVPDLRGTTSTFFILCDSFTPEQLAQRLSGGLSLPIHFDGNDVTEVEVPGPRDTRYPFDDPRGFAKQVLKIQVDRVAHKGLAEAGGRKVDLEQGRWSDWLEWEFRMTSRFTAHSITRFYPLEIDEQVRIYMSCHQFHPSHPYASFTHPQDYSKTLQGRYGLFKTIGWTYDTHALRQGALDEEGFLKDVRHTMAWHERLTLDELDRGEFDLLISGWTATDRVGHMFWRYRDPHHPLYDPEKAQAYGHALEETYRIMDAIVGKIVEKLREGDLFCVFSDHGFESWRTGFNVNTWLRELGYLAVKTPELAKEGFLTGIDWAKTRAYSVGLSSLYLNLQGRETQGTVERARADGLVAELREKLLGVKDPFTGHKAFSNVYTRNDYSGEAMDEAPDIVLGYDRYFQSSKDCAKGAVAQRLFEPNEDKWSGEHAASDAAWIPGMLLTNRLIEKDDPDIRDLGITALKFLGKDIPSDFEGTSLM